MTLRVRAPAKVNLYLRVLGRRRDGYHDLETVFHTVGLFDDVTLASAASLTLMATGLPSPGGEANLCLKAARLLARRCRVTAGARIRLIKRIPSGAGLGGGSADAAACLVGLNRLWRLGLSATALSRLAADLGSDVPFFLTTGAAVGRGRGERLTSVRSRLRAWAVILKPGFSIATRSAFADLDAIPAAHRTCPAATLAGVVRAVTAGDLDGLRVHNDFEQPAAARHPRLSRLRTGLLRSGARAAFLTGSGSAMVGLYPTPRAAGRAARSLGARWHAAAFSVPVRPCPLRPVRA